MTRPEPTAPAINRAHKEAIVTHDVDGFQVSSAVADEMLDALPHEPMFPRAPVYLVEYVAKIPELPSRQDPIALTAVNETLRALLRQCGEALAEIESNALGLTKSRMTIANLARAAIEALRKAGVM